MDFLPLATIILGPSTWIIAAIVLLASGIAGLVRLFTKKATTTETNGTDETDDADEPTSNEEASTTQPSKRRTWPIIWSIIKILFGVLTAIGTILATIYANDIRETFPWPF